MTDSDQDQLARHRYDAFISYSHKDERFASWLHHTLESYRLPKDLIAQSKRGKERIAPVFRDQEELPAATSLTEEIRAALRASEALIVVCSPAGAGSPWVQKEIEYFLSLGRDQALFAIIAAGEPHAKEPGLECLPPALREPGSEVFAPDARVEGAPRKAAALKLIGGLHGLALGQIVERDAARRRVRRLRMVSLATAVLAVVGTLATAWWGESRRLESERKDRLLALTRAAFEDGNPEQGIAALAAAWPGLSAAEKVQYGLTAAGWAAAFPDLRDALEALKDSGVFQASGRLFFHDGKSLIRLPYDKNVLAVASKELGAAYALSPSGQVIEWKFGADPPQVIAEKARSVGGFPWAKILWREAAALRGGTILFAGNLDADQLSEQRPVLLVVRPMAKRWHFINLEDDWFERSRKPGLFLSRDCSSLAWVASPGAVAAGGGTSYEQVMPMQRAAIYRLALDNPLADAKTFEGELSGFTGVIPGHAEDFLSGFAGRCSVGAVSLSGTGAPDLSLPARSAQGEDRNAADPDLARQISAKARTDRDAHLAEFANFADRIQRGKFDLPAGTDQAAKGIIAAAFPGFFMDVLSDDTFHAVLYADSHRTPGGYDRWEDRYACVWRKGATSVLCSSLRLHRSNGVSRIYPSFAYIPGGRVPDDPMFVMLTLPELRHVEFRESAFAGESGVGGAASALSPSGRRLALLSGGEVLLFGLSRDLKATFSARFDVPALLGSFGRIGIGEDNASPAFVGENRLATARQDGLVAMVDLPTGQEVWRFRIPGVQANTDRRSRIDLVAPDDASWLAVRGRDFVALLDPGSGLPLNRPARSYFRGETGPAIERNTGQCENSYFVGRCFEAPGDRLKAENPSLFTEECVSRYPLRRCFSRAELAEIFRRAEPQPGGWIATAPDGSLVAELPPDEWNVLLGRISRQGQTIQDPYWPAIRCRTGWQVEETRMTRFDPFADIGATSKPTPFSVVAERCAKRATQGVWRSALQVFAP